MDKSLPNVIITGFGPFRDCDDNPSWRAIKDESDFKIERPVNIIRKQIEVAYHAVDEAIPQLWQEYNPLMMIHIGLANKSSLIKLEQRARLGPYCQGDVRQCILHPENQSSEIEPKETSSVKYNEISTCFELRSICEKVNSLVADKKLTIPATISDDAGLYVCEYIYLSSLKIKNKAIFIHIPNTTNFKIEEIRKTLKVIIESLIDSLNDK